MARLIELPEESPWPEQIVLNTGDLLWIRAAGARILESDPAMPGAVVELLGPFAASLIGSTGEIMTPAGPPNAVIVRACGRGQAVVEFLTGDPWHEVVRHSLQLRIRDVEVPSH